MLILLGGLSKAVWKLILVTGGQDLTWLASALFPFGTAAFALGAYWLWRSARLMAICDSPRVR